MIDPADKGFKYSAFISYSHRDERWAKWLQTALETYRVPRHLVGRVASTGLIPRRLPPVFCDRSDLPSATDLQLKLNIALHEAGSLIVICSPAACASHWVNEEIRQFQRCGRPILCFIVAGEPHASRIPGHEAEECFAPALGFDDDAASQSTEPLAADARVGRDGRLNAKLKILAGLWGIGLDELKQRDLRRRHQRLLGLTAMALIALAIVSGLAVQAIIARSAAERRQKAAETLVGFMLGDLNQKLRHVQRLDILEAVNDQAMAYFSSLPTQDVTDQALALRVSTLQKIGEVRADQGNLSAALEAHQTASELAAELLRRAPENADRQAAYAETLNFIGHAYWFQGKPDPAYEHFTRSIALFERATQGASPPARLAALASARTNAGRVLESRGDLDGAKVMYQAVRASFETLAAQDIAGARWQPELADSYDSLGKLDVEQGQLSQAIAAYRRVRQIRADLLAQSPGDRAAQEDLVFSDAILGRSLSWCGADADSLHYVSEAVNTARTLVDYDASFADWREEYGEYSSLWGSLLRSQGRLEDAAMHDHEALAVLSALVETDKTNVTWRHELASAQTEWARWQLAQGQLEEGEATLATAVGTLAADLAESPADRALQLLAAQAYLVRGEERSRRGRAMPARQDWMRARDAAAVARVGDEPNALAAWTMALMLLDDSTTAAQAAIDQLATMGYQTIDFLAVLHLKHYKYAAKSAASTGGEDATQLTAGL